MKNYAMPAAIATVGLGLLSIGFNLNGNQANATPAAFNAGSEGSVQVATPRVVDFAISADAPLGGSVDGWFYHRPLQIIRLWSNGVVDFQNTNNQWSESGDCSSVSPLCTGTEDWIPFLEDGTNYIASEDINGDRVIDATDLGLILANWGPSSAALLYNPDLGDAEVVSIECDWMRLESRDTLMIYRGWSTGLIEMALLNSEAGATCMPSGGGSACWDGWQPVPGSLPVANAVGDFNRSGFTDAADLGRLLGAWSK